MTPLKAHLFAAFDLFSWCSVWSSRLPLRDGMRVGYGREQWVRGVSVKDSSGVLPTVPGVEEYCVLPDRG